LRAPFFVGAALGGVALLTLLPSVSRRTFTEQTESTIPFALRRDDDTPVAIEVEPW
jgi:hypothetical protein